MTMFPASSVPASLPSGGNGGGAAMTNYTALYESLRSRKLKPAMPKNLDIFAVKLQVAADRRRITLSDLRRRADAIVAMSPKFRNVSDAVLDQQISDIREVFVRRRQSSEHIDSALAMIREVARRETGEEPFAVQLIAALAMQYGRMVEMLTGEGKTLTGSITAPLIAWQHRWLHVLTVNDYLAQRDAQSRACIFKRCGLRVGAITQETENGERFDIYSRDIVYGTPKQIVADWLRDQIRLGRATTPWNARSMATLMGGEDAADKSRSIMPMVPGLHAALVDEADAVLVDEGVIPLIIARARTEDEMSTVYREAAELAGKLEENVDYSLEPVRRKATLKLRGEDRCKQLFAALADRGGSAIWRATRRGEELVRQALVAKHCYVRGQQYEVVDGKVVIVDEYTGRFLPDRSWEHGLHQAVEAKEGVEVTADRETLARLSFQRYFRSYPFMCGMTGTAADATGEMESTYRRPVMVVPTNRPIARKQMPTRIFRSAREKWSAIADSVADIHGQGRPVLVGTRSVAASETISRMLEQRGIQHSVLNANFDKDEAEIIARAGKGGLHAHVTVATNMAGRGTDIKLDESAKSAGGLHVILTEMHSAKRIDRQFIGRAGRQGDPGSAQIFVSLEDELLRKFAKWPSHLIRQRFPRSELTDVPGILQLLAWAQRRAQSHDRRNRDSVLKQDDWIDKHLPGVG